MVFKRELKWLLRELAEIVGEIEAGIKYFSVYLPTNNNEAHETKFYKYYGYIYEYSFDA